MRLETSIMSKKTMDISNRKTHTMEVLLTLFAGLLASMPLLLKGIDGIAYQDLAFHLSRIEGLSEGIKAGRIPVMMQSVWLFGKGYPVSIFYGDLLLYVPALLRIAGVPVILTYKLYILFINLLTSFVFTKCAKAIFGDGIKAAFGAVLYLSASYRMVDIYVRNAAGEYTAFLFFPLVAYAVYRLFNDDLDDTKGYLKNSLLLAFAMTGLIETHLLSTVMTVFLLAIVCLFFAKKTFRKKTLLGFLLAVLETVLLNLYFFVPFLDYYTNVPVYIGKGGDHSQALQIRQYGASIKQLFSFFSKLFGFNSYDPIDRMQLTTGLPLMVVLIVAFVYFVVKKREYRTFVYGFMSLLCIWMSTSLFPWNTLEGYTHLFKFLSQVQFPWRYLAPAIFFISLLFVDIVTYPGIKTKINFSGILEGITLCLAVVMTVVFTISYAGGYTSVNYKSYEEVDSGYIGACEYLKNNVSLSELTYVPQNENFETCDIIKSKDNSVEYYVKNGDCDNNLEVDKLNYKGYVAVTDKGEHLEIFDGYNDLITVVVPAGYEGNIKVSFKQPVSWVVAEIISLLSAILFLVLYKKKDPQ